MPSPWTSRNIAPASPCISHQLQCFLGDTCPPFITMAGAGPALAAVLPWPWPRWGCDPEVVMHVGMVKRGSTPTSWHSTSPAACSHSCGCFHLLFLFFVLVVQSWVGHKCSRVWNCIAWPFCLGRTISRDMMEGWAGDRLGVLAQLNPALPLPGGLAAYMGSLLLRTGDCTTAWREEPIPLESAKRPTMTVLSFTDFYFWLCTERGCDCSKASNALLNSSWWIAMFHPVVGQSFTRLNQLLS